ncbi:MAG: gephyrin-like molybdotransferase Glp [Planctomycetota bacterium]
MLTVDAALELVLRTTPAPRCVQVPLDSALGLTLAAPITSDLDSPPHDKSLVDGYAARWSDIAAGQTLEVLEEILAGAVPQQPIRSGTATRLMTGAPIPQGADAVVMVEHSELETSTREPAVGERHERVRLRPPRGQVGMNIMRRGQSMTQGSLVLPAGKLIRPVEIGLLAEVGCVQVPVYAPPTVAILSTGNELVPASERPGPGQIRNSNGPLLQAAVERMGATPRNLGVAVDTAESLAAAIGEGLTADVLILSGGVSAGVADLVPALLQEQGVQQIFHKIQLRPGKPLWFGVLPRSPQNRLVFGLPGNPVSSLVCFELFVRPALERLLGRAATLAAPAEVRLARPFHHRGDRPTYYPARWRAASESSAQEPAAVGRGEQWALSGAAPPTIELLNWQGSADLRTLAEATGFACFPAGEREYASGDLVEWRALS